MKKRGPYLTKGKIAKTKATTFSPKAKKIAEEILKQIRKEEDRRLMLKHEYGEIEEQTIKRLDKASLNALKRYGKEKKIEKQIEEMLKEKGASKEEATAIRQEILQQISLENMKEKIQKRLKELKEKK